MIDTGQPFPDHSHQHLPAPPTAAPGLACNNTPPPNYTYVQYSSTRVPTHARTWAQPSAILSILLQYEYSNRDYLLSLLIRVSTFRFQIPGGSAKFILQSNRIRIHHPNPQSHPPTWTSFFLPARSRQPACDIFFFLPERPFARISSPPKGSHILAPYIPIGGLACLRTACVRITESTKQMQPGCGARHS